MSGAIGNLPGREILLAVVLQPDDACCTAHSSPVVEHAHQNDIEIAIAVKAHRCRRVSATECPDSLRLKLPAPEVPQPDAAMPWLGVGVANFQIVTGHPEQIRLAVLVEIGHHEAR